MNITVDVSSAAKREPTGIGRYVLELTRAMVPLLDPADRLRLSLRPSRWKSREWIEPLSRLPGVRPPRWIDMALPGVFAGPSTILHSLGVWLPPATRALKAVSIHDTYTIDDPALARKHWARGRSAKIRKVVKRADLVLTISKHSRDRILHHFPELGEDRVLVTYLGFDHAEALQWIGPHAPPADSTVPDDGTILRKHGLEGRPYVLFVGSIARRKNPEGLLRAFARARAARDHLLVYAGVRSDSDIDAVAEASRLGDRVRFLGRVEDADLGALYRGAAVFALPSFHEGFGIPIIEAMACAIPCITSSTTACGEVAGDAALTVDPSKEDELAGAIDRVLSDEDLRDRLRHLGPEQAARFRWRSCAEATIDAYRTLAHLGPRKRT